MTISNQSINEKPPQRRNQTTEDRGQRTENREEKNREEMDKGRIVYSFLAILKRLFSDSLFFFLSSELCLLSSPAQAELKNFQEADVVVGQPDFTTGTAVTSQTRTNDPFDVCSDGRRLFVVDNSHRVLIWNSIPTVNSAPADVVLGQPNFTSSTENNGGISAASFDTDTQAACATDGKRLFVVEYSNNRVKIWNSIPTSNFAPADVVVGQTSFTTRVFDATASNLRTPADVFTDGRRLFVIDSSNHRVLIWNSIPTQNFAPADVVVGQPDFTSRTIGTAANRLNTPTSVFSDGKRLIVSDYFNNRVLIWNAIPKTNGASADVVLGQPNFATNASGLGNNRMICLSL